MKNVTVLINSMTDGGAEMVLSQLCKKNIFNKIILLENLIKFDLPNQRCIIIREKYVPLIGKLTSIFTSIFKLKLTSTVCLSFLKRSNFVNVLAKPWYKHKAIISEHSVPAMDGNKIVKQINKKVICVLYNLADLLIVPSQGVRNILIKDFKIKIPIVVIPNPVDISSIETLKIEELKDISEEELFNKRVFLSIGRFNHVKNQLETIKIFNNFLETSKDLQSHLVFLGEGELLEECVLLVENLNCANRIHFLGFKKNVYKYLWRSHSMILNSKWESFGNVIIEAFASSCPVICTDIPVGPGEILRAKGKLLSSNNKFSEFDCGVLVTPSDNDAFLKAMIFSIDDVNWGKKKDRVVNIVNEYSLDFISKKYIKEFNKYV